MNQQLYLFSNKFINVWGNEFDHGILHQKFGCMVQWIHEPLKYYPYFSLIALVRITIRIDLVKPDLNVFKSIMENDLKDLKIHGILDNKNSKPGNGEDVLTVASKIFKFCASKSGPPGTRFLYSF